MRYLADEEREWHERTQLPICAYTPTADGYFAKGASDSFNSPENEAKLARVKQLAAKSGVSENQIALAYLMNQPFLTIPILGTTNEEHLRDAIGAAKICLDDEQVRWLREGVSID